MGIRVYTQSGAVYFLDLKAMTWGRSSPDAIARNTRTQGGPLREKPKIEVGRSMELICPPLDPRATFRRITTTPVVKIEVQG